MHGPPAVPGGDELRRVATGHDEEPRPIREINSEIPEWLCQVIARLMAKEPDARFASARDVAELLEECLVHVQQPTVVPLPAVFVHRYRGRRKFSISRRSFGVIVMIAALGLSLLGIVLWTGLKGPDSNEPRSNAVCGCRSSTGRGRAESDGSHAKTRTPFRESHNRP